MDKSTQFFNFKKSQPIEKCSSFYVMIEGFADMKLNENFPSKKIQFLDSDDVWWISFNKCKSGSCFYVQLKLFLQASDFILKSKVWSCSVFGTVNEKQFNSGRLSIIQKDMVFSQNIVLDKQKPFLELNLTMTISRTEDSNIKPLQMYTDKTVQIKKIISNNECILNESKYSDFTFIVQGKKFKVHKIILAVASPVFATLFETKLSESLTNECCVTDIEPIIFQYLLNFIYCAKLPEQLDEENVSRKLFKAAHYYQINELMDICSSVEHYKLSKDNAVDIYEWADTYDLENIKMDAWKIIQFDILEIIDVKQLPTIHSIRALIASKKENEKCLEECRIKRSKLTKDLLE